jgi:hypothetical protein
MTTASALRAPQKRALFIDVDGVLHPAGLPLPQIDGPVLQGLMAIVEAYRLFRWREHLAELVAPHPDVRIVVHSSWQQVVSDLQTWRDLLGEGIAGGERVIDVVGRGKRYQAIRRYFHTSGLQDYRILDDDPEQFPADTPELILCDPRTGISATDVQQALRTWLKGGYSVLLPWR